MLRVSGVAGAIVFVEGPRDARLLRRVLNSALAIVVTTAKYLVIEAVLEAKRLGCAGVVGLVDSDGETVPASCANDNLVAWDWHDCEITIVESVGFDSIIAEYCTDTNKVAKCLAHLGCANIRALLYCMVARAGMARLIARQRGVHLRFDEVEIANHFDTKTLSLKLGGYLRACLEASDGLASEAATLEDAVVSAVEGFQDDVRDLVHGKDVVSALAFSMRNGLASASGKKRLPSSEAAWLGVLHVCFSVGDFEETKIARALRRWQRCNPSYPMWP